MGNSIGGNSDIKKESADNELDIGLLIKKIISRWHYLVISLLVCFICSFLYLRYATPIYLVNARVLIKDDKSTGGATGDLMDLSSLMGIKSNVDNEAEVLKTRSIMEKVVRDMQLNATFFRTGNIRDVEISKSPLILSKFEIQDSIIPIKLFFSKISATNFLLSYTSVETSESVKKTVNFGDIISLNKVGNIQVVRNPAFVGPIDEEFFLDLRSVDEKVETLSNSVSIAVTNKNVTIVDLSLTYPVPDRGQNILAKLIETYVNQNIREKNRIADSTISFIDNRLNSVGQELAGVENFIQNFKQSNQLADITEQSKQLIGLSGEAIQDQANIETQISIIDATLKNLIHADNNKVIASSLLEGDAVFAGLVDNYNSKLLELERLSISSTSNNPFVKSVQDQIFNLKSAMISNLNSTRKSLTLKLNQITGNSSRVAGAIRKVPAQERVYLDLARQQQIKQELYIYLLQKREETAISKTSNISNSLTIDPPKADYKPVSPNKILVLGLAILIGIFAPIGIILLKDMLNRRIISKNDIKSNTVVPIIGEISHNDTKVNLVILKEARSPISEQFRALRTNTQFFLNGEDEKVVLVTSSMPGEGKSFMSINFANVLAVQGKKVVIVELDLRKPKVSIQFNLDNKIGFSNFIISKKMTIEEILRPSGVHENLFVISSGPIPPNPAELLLHTRTEELIRSLKEKFDYVIIDSPPIGLVTDAQLMSKFTDLTLYVVRQNYTFKEQLSIPEELYSGKKMRKIGLVVNDIEVKSKYGYGYGYGYGRGYGYYSEQDDKKTGWFSKIKEYFSKG